LVISIRGAVRVPVAGKKVVGGGGIIAASGGTLLGEFSITESRPTADNIWQVTATIDNANITAGTWTIMAYAVCVT
jgi:hypothetical protein